MTRSKKKSWERSRRGCVALWCAGVLATSVAQAATEGPGAPLLEVQRFIVEGENPLSEAETEALLRPHLGRHESLATLEAAADKLQQAIRDRGYSFHRVIVPAQQPTGGELRLRVLPFTLGQATVTGNQHFSIGNILRSVPGLKIGQAPNIGLLAQQLSLANEHPSKRVTLQIRESEKPDSVDAELRVADVAPSQFFVSVTGGSRDFDNTLNKNTGYTRVTLGYQHSNLFDRDHTVTLAYTTSPEHPDRVTQLGAFYTVPFYGLNTQLTGYYTYSDVNSGTVGLGGQSFDVNGSGEFYGAKLTYLLPRFLDVVHNVSVAWDEKYFKSNVAFLGAPLPSTTVGSRPITFRYAARLEKDPAVFAGYAEYAFNLGGGRANTDQTYAASRAGAMRDWEVYRYGLDAAYSIGGRWSLSGKFRGQHTDDALIQGEQLGIAGANAVRGFREREVTGDRGYYANLELIGPPVVLDIAPLAFYDFGMRSFVTPVIGQATKDHISSAGAGVRWRWQQLDVSVTWAHVLNGVAGGTPRDFDKFHFSAFYRF